MRFVKRFTSGRRSNIKRVDSRQLSLLFDIPYYSEAQTDNQRFMNMQKRYIIDNDTKALADMYRLGVKVALKMINKFAGSNRHLQSLARMERSEKAHHASSYIVEQYLKRPTFYIKKSYTAYLYKRVQYELFYHRKIDAAIIYCDMTNALYS